MRARGILCSTVFVVGICTVPLVVTDPYFLSVCVFIGIYSIATLGLNLLLGYAGQISLGHAAFFAIGAYLSGILTTARGLHFLPAALCGVAVAVVVACVVGIPCLRLRGHYLAMGTLAFGEIVFIVLNAAVDLTGGPSGIAGIPQLELGGFEVDSDLKYYCVVWLVFAVLMVLTRNLIDSRTGRALRCLHSSEQAAGAMGINVARLKMAVFVLSAAYAALAGVLYAHYVTFISPQSAELMFSIRLLTMVVVGGMGHLWGGVVGAGVLTLLPEVLSYFEDYDMLIYGCVLLAMVMFLPGGLTRGGELLLGRLRRRDREGRP